MKSVLMPTLFMIASIFASCSRVDTDATIVTMVENSTPVTMMEMSSVEAHIETSAAKAGAGSARVSRGSVFAMSSGPVEKESEMVSNGFAEGSGLSSILDLIWDLGFTSAGFRAGAAYSSTASSESTTRGTLLGLAAEMKLARMGAFTFAMETNLNYLRRDIALAGGSINTEYLGIPVIGKVRWPGLFPGIPGRIRLFSGFGVDSNIRLTSHFHHDADNTDYRYDSNLWDIAMLVNIGGEISMGSFGSLVTELRYSYGITPAIAGQTMYFKNFGYNDINIREERVSSYMLVLGYNYRLHN